MKEVIALAKEKALSYSSAGIGNGQHLAGELFSLKAGIHLLHVPYKGMAQATTDLVGGQVDCAIQGVVAVIPFAKNQVRVLAWTGSTRNSIYPDLPTLNEAGVTGYNYQPWTGLFGPAAMPRAIVTRLNEEMRKALSAGGLREKWAPQGMEIVDATPQQIEKMIRDEYERMGKLIKQTGIRLE